MFAQKRPNSNITFLNFWMLLKLLFYMFHVFYVFEPQHKSFTFVLSRVVDELNMKLVLFSMFCLFEAKWVFDWLSNKILYHTGIFQVSWNKSTVAYDLFTLCTFSCSSMSVSAPFFQLLEQQTWMHLCNFFVAISPHLFYE